MQKLYFVGIILPLLMEATRTLRVAAKADGIGVITTIKVPSIRPMHILRCIVVYSPVKNCCKAAASYDLVHRRLRSRLLSLADPKIAAYTSSSRWITYVGGRA